MPDPIPEPQLDDSLLQELERAVEQFNAGRFFECHDTLEDVWHGLRGPARNFLQGLIQVAVGFYHLGNGNQRGAESQLRKGLENLQPYSDLYAGVDLGRLREELRRWVRMLREGEVAHVELADLPKYHFTRPG